MLKPALKQTLAFLIVGASAACVHEGVVIGLVEWGGVQPLSANVGGFLSAFSVSYAGHRRFTFESHLESGGGGWRSLPKFFLVAFAAFLLNQLLFYALLRWTALPYSVALFLVLMAVAAGTFFVSKWWAFKP